MLMVIYAKEEKLKRERREGGEPKLNIKYEKQN